MLPPNTDSDEDEELVLASKDGSATSSEFPSEQWMSEVIRKITLTTKGYRG